MKPFGSAPWYWYPGRRVIQFGDSSRNESHAPVRQAFADAAPFDHDMIDPALCEARLIASPACPPPMTTVWVRISVLW